MGLDGGLYPDLAKKDATPAINSIGVKVSLPAPRTACAVNTSPLYIQGHLTYIFHPTKELLSVKFSTQTGIVLANDGAHDNY